MKNNTMEWMKEVSVKDVPLLLTSAAGAVATYFGEILSAMPFLITVCFQIYLKWRKHKQLEKQHEEQHKLVIKLLEEGRGREIPKEILKLNLKEDENE
jgi:hypothetical protein